ncbi:MAG: DUF669 domain-containing protein, partial [Xanthobacteraceae bacterium]|nr:DUF669 domain-containing protein [Xanthobacteraceae bacterium]
MAKINYNTNETDPAPEFENFTGTELAEIVESDEQENSQATGRLLVLLWKICEGEPHAGRQIFQNINYIHESAQTQAFGQRDLNAVCKAVGHEGHLEETELLHNIPCRVTFGLSKPSTKYPEPKTEVKTVKPANADVPETKPQERTAAPSKPVPAASKPAASGSAPWKK